MFAPGSTGRAVGILEPQALRSFKASLLHSTWCFVRGLLAVSLLILPSIAQAEEPPVIRVGGGEGYAPFHFVEDGRPTGFDVELLEAVADATGLRVEIQLGNWRDHRIAFEAGELDMLVGVTVSERRRGGASFSVPIAYAQHRAFVLRDLDRRLAGVDALRGERVAVQRGSVAFSQLASWIPGATAQPVDSAEEALRALEKGEVLAYVANEYRARHEARQIGLAIRALGEVLDSRGVAFMVHRGDEELVKRLNLGIALVKQRGVYDELYSRWFGILERDPFSTRALRIALFVLASVSLLLLLSLAWSRSLRRTVQRKTGELERELDEHRSTLEALRRSEARFETLFRASPMITAIVELPGGRVIDVNDSVKEVLGFDRDELIGRTTAELGLYVDPNIHEETTAELSRKPVVVKDEVKVRGRGGEQHTFFASLAAIELEGRPAALVVAADMTEVERSRRRLIDARRIEVVGKLAGTVAHDFNNILTSIHGHAELCRDEISAKGGDLEHLESILEATQQASALVRQMLALGRQQLLEARVADVGEVFEAFMSAFEAELDGSLRLEIAEESEGARVEVDVQQIAQVIWILAINARSAMPEGGRIRLVSRRVALDESRCGPGGEVPPGSYVLIEIEDEGRAIDEDELPNVFQPAPGSDRGGLELATAQGIVHQSGGFITVENRHGGGRLFSLYLPESRETSQAAAPVAEGRSREGVGRVLLVEDESPVCALICRILRTLGYEVSSWQRAEDALQAIRSGAVDLDLLITDVLMPGLDGRELAERVREILPDLPILFISGYAEREIFHRIGSIDGTSFLRKPFGARDLGEAVRRALDGTPSIRGGA